MSENSNNLTNNSQKKGVSAVDFFCIGFGAIVGVGWAVAINGWITSCGGPVPAALGYLLVMVMMVPVGLCYAELVPMMPVAGGVMAFSLKAFNSTVSIIGAWGSLGGMIAIIPWEAIQVTDILNYLIPSLKLGDPLYQVMGSDIYLTTIIIGVIFSFLLFALNMRGLASAAFVQKILCFMLIGCAILGGVVSLIYGNSDNMKPIYDVSNPQIYGEASKIGRASCRERV